MPRPCRSPAAPRSGLGRAAGPPLRTPHLSWFGRFEVERRPGERWNTAESRASCPMAPHFCPSECCSEGRWCRGGRGAGGWERGWGSGSWALEVWESQGAVSALLPCVDLGGSPKWLRASVSPHLWPAQGSFSPWSHECTERREGVMFIAGGGRNTQDGPRDRASLKEGNVRALFVPPAPHGRARSSHFCPPHICLSYRGSKPEACWL